MLKKRQKTIDGLSPDKKKKKTRRAGVREVPFPLFFFLGVCLRTGDISCLFFVVVCVKIKI